MAEFNPEEVLPNLFFEATDAMAQVPLAGIVRLGRLAAETDNWRECVGYDFKGPVLDDLVARTTARHEELGITRNANLPVTLPFTWDLVRSGLVAAVAGIHASGRERQSISPASELDLRTASTLMRNPANRGMFGKLFEAADTMLELREVRDYIGVFKKGGFPTGSYNHRLLEIAYECADDPEERRKRLEKARADLTSFVLPEMTDRLQAVRNLPPGWDAERLAHNLTIWKPAKSLIDKHFPKTK